MRQRRHYSSRNSSSIFFGQRKIFVLLRGRKDKKSEELILKIFFAAGKISEDFVKKWQNGKLKPHNIELKLLKEGCDEVLAAFDSHFKKELLAYQKKPYDVHYAEAKEKNKRIRNLLKN